MHWLYVILVGIIAGWLAGLLMKGRGFGLLGNIVVGILGAVIGSWIFSTLNVYAGSGILGNIFTALVGAIVLLFIVGLVVRR